MKHLKKNLKDIQNTKYCLKMDIRKCYPSIDHLILKNIVRKKIKDKRLLELLDGIIDSAPGIPIGNYLSQFFANLYLSYFDHWLK
ncbi:RNA-directed DNA polymerase, partial [Salmonella enterica]|uniref:RNA-directed DNA polymerase n=1 Tax=Salmonella enterica TaxID=28901 RepID=UPI003CE96C03